MIAKNLAFMFGAGLLVLPVFASSLGLWFYPLLFIGFLFGVELSRSDLDASFAFPFVLAAYVSGLALHLNVNPLWIVPIIILPFDKLNLRPAFLITISLLLVSSSMGLAYVSEPNFIEFNASSIYLFLFTTYFAFFADSVSGQEFGLRKVSLALSFIIYTLFVISTASPIVPTLLTQYGTIFAVILLTHSLFMFSGESKSPQILMQTFALSVVYQMAGIDFLSQVVFGGVMISTMALYSAIKKDNWRLAALSLLPFLVGVFVA